MIVKVNPTSIAVFVLALVATLFHSNSVVASEGMRLEIAMEELSVRNAAASYAAIADDGFAPHDVEKLFAKDIELFEVSAKGGDKSSEPAAQGIDKVSKLLQKRSMDFTGKSLTAKHMVGATQIMSMGWRIEHTCLTITNVLIVSSAGQVAVRTHEDHWLGDGLGNWKIVKKVIISN